MIGLSALILFVSLCATMINAELITPSTSTATASPGIDASVNTTLTLAAITDTETAPATPATCGGTTVGTTTVPAAITIDLKSQMVVSAVNLYIKSPLTTPVVNITTNNAAKVTVSIGNVTASSSILLVCSPVAPSTADVMFDTNGKATVSCNGATVQNVVIQAATGYVLNGIYLCNYQIDNTPLPTTLASTTKAANVTAKSVSVSRFDWIMLLTMSLAAIVKMVGVGQE